jgi:hypothetical protein
MIDTDKYEGHTKGGWYVDDAPDVIHPTVIHENQCDAMVAELVAITGEWTEEDYANARLIADAPLLLAEVKRLRKALYIEEQIVQAFYEYREDCCFDHCEAWMLENGHRVVVKIDDDEHTEWKVEVE